MKKKKLICVVIALVILLGGVVMGYLGLRGQGEYNHVSEMLGTGRPETINYIQDPTLLTSISYEQDPEALRAFWWAIWGYDEASVDAAIEARQVYAEKQAESQAFDTFSAYLKEQDPTLTDEGVQDLIKDRETSDPMRAEMLKQSVMTELGIDEAAYEALASDTAILDLMRGRSAQPDDRRPREVRRHHRRLRLDHRRHHARHLPARRSDRASRGAHRRRRAAQPAGGRAWQGRRHRGWRACRPRDL